MAVTEHRVDIRGHDVFKVTKAIDVDVQDDNLKLMKHGAVIIDVCIDQGGCTETSRPTSHAEPTYIVDGIVHYCVTNMPGAVGRTSTYALCNVTFPYVRQIAAMGLSEAAAKEPGLVDAVNIIDRKVTNQAVAETFGIPLAEFK